MKLIVVAFLALLLLNVPMTPDAVSQTVELMPEQCLGGNLDAPIRIEVFSDFECPHCKDFYLDTISLVLKEYCSQNKVCVVYREFPLPDNLFSWRAAQFAKAAQKIGRQQWRAVMSALYENQDEWSVSGSIDAFVSKSLTPEDYSRLKNLLQDPSIDQEITKEIALGEKRDVALTPTFFVYVLGKEQKIAGVLSYTVLKSFFDKVLK